MSIQHYALNETLASRNHYADLAIRVLPSVDRRRALDLDFLPGVRKSWALSFLRLEENAPTGRCAGSLSWPGLANLYFWMDRKNDAAGFRTAQGLPFLHPWATEGFAAFEREVHRGLRKGWQGYAAK